MTTRTWKVWPPEEDALLRRVWAKDGTLKESMHLFPGRTHRAAIAHGYDLGLAPRVNVKRRNYSPTWAAIRTVLADRRMRSAVELARETGASRRAVMQQLSDHHGKGVRIAGYGELEGAGTRPALWKLGRAKDVPRPLRTPLAVIYKRQYRRLKEERPDLLAARNAAMRLRYAEKTGKLIRRDPAAGWIGTTQNHTTP